MAEFKGKRCDSCGKVVAASESTRKTIRFSGPHVRGEYAEDLCEECICIPDGVTLKPLRTRSGSTHSSQVA